MTLTSTPNQVVEIIGQAKDGFATWKKLADKENIEKCKNIWDEYDADKSNTMDLQEINAVIAALQSAGFSPEPMTAADMPLGGEMEFAEFSAWFVAQEGLPGYFSTPKVRKTPSWPRSWASFSPLWLYFHRNALANFHVLG